MISATACMPEETAPDLFACRPVRDAAPMLDFATYGLTTENNTETPIQAPTDGTWPTRPITIIVPFLAGGDTDIYARMLAPYLTEILGQPVHVINIDGMGGAVGTAHVHEAEPDGYTVLFYHSGSLFSNALAGSTPLNYSDFVMSCVVVRCDANVMLINAGLGVNDAEAFIALAKNHPNELSVAVTNTGFSGLLMQMAERAGDFELHHVDVGGAALMIQAVLNSHANATNVNVALYAPHANNDALIPIWISSSQRNPSLPHVPTLAEVGIENGYIGRSYFFAFPENTDEYIAQKLSDAVGQITGNQEFIQQLLNVISLPPQFVPFDEVTTYMHERWMELSDFNMGDS